MPPQREFGFCGMTEEFCTGGSGDKKGCQSNCDQPGSSASGGDVQSRIIGYYESWAHDRSCNGMVGFEYTHSLPHFTNFETRISRTSPLEA